MLGDRSGDRAVDCPDIGVASTVGCDLGEAEGEEGWSVHPPCSSSRGASLRAAGLEEPEEEEEEAEAEEARAEAR